MRLLMMFATGNMETAEHDEITQISLRWDHLIKDASTVWMERQGLFCTPVNRPPSLDVSRTLLVEQNGEEISLDKMLENESESDDKSVEELKLELQKELQQDRDHQRERDLERVQEQKLELERAQSLEMELARLQVQENELVQGIEKDFDFEDVFGDGSQNFSYYVGFGAGFGVMIWCMVKIIAPRFLKPPHRDVKGFIVLMVFVGDLLPIVGGFVGAGIMMMLLMFTCCFWACFWGRVRRLMWRWERRLELAKQADLEVQREHERQQEKGQELGIDPDVLSEKEKELLRVQGITWMRIRMLVLTLTLAKERLGADVVSEHSPI